MVKGGQVELSLTSTYQDLGIPMKFEIQSDSSTANSLTDRLGAGQRTKHIDTRYFWTQERVQDGDFSIKKVPTAKNCADVGSLSTSHDERIMTAVAIARSKARKRCNAMANATPNFEQWLTPNLAITFRAQKCAMMTERERADFFFRTKVVLVQ